MAVKTARILLGAYALGGPHFISGEAVERIHTRPDELYRRKVSACQVTPEELADEIHGD